MRKGLARALAGAACPAALIFVAQGAAAADAINGKRLAQQHCGACHIVMPNQRLEVADSPPFETIATKHRLDAASIAAAILDPHPRMNVTLAPQEADDLAAYMITLVK